MNIAKISFVEGELQKQKHCFLVCQLKCGKKQLVYSLT